MIYLQLLLISAACCFIIDISGFMDSLKRGVHRLLRGRALYIDFSMKPFDCSLCASLWGGLIWLGISHWYFGLHITFWACAFCLFLAYISPIITNILLGIKEMLIRITNKIG